MTGVVCISLLCCEERRVKTQVEEHYGMELATLPTHVVVVCDCCVVVDDILPMSRPLI